MFSACKAIDVRSLLSIVPNQSKFIVLAEFKN